MLSLELVFRDATWHRFLFGNTCVGHTPFQQCKAPGSLEGIPPDDATWRILLLRIKLAGHTMCDASWHHSFGGDRRVGHNPSDATWHNFLSGMRIGHTPSAAMQGAVPGGDPLRGSQIGCRLCGRD